MLNPLKNLHMSEKMTIGLNRGVHPKIFFEGGRLPSRWVCTQERSIHTQNNTYVCIVFLLQYRTTF